MTAERSPLVRASMSRRQAMLGNLGLVMSAGAIAACQVPSQTAAPRMDEREVTLSYLTDWTGARVQSG